MKDLTQIALLNRLAALAKREHDHCDDNYYSCPKDPEAILIQKSCYALIPGIEYEEPKCECGADEHNAEVSIVYNELIKTLNKDAER